MSLTAFAFRYRAVTVVLTVLLSAVGIFALGAMSPRRMGGELREIGLSQTDRTRCRQHTDDVRVLLRHSVFIVGGANGRTCPGGIEKILVHDRNPVQRTPIPTLLPYPTLSRSPRAGRGSARSPRPSTRTGRGPSTSWRRPRRARPGRSASPVGRGSRAGARRPPSPGPRSEEHTSELQSLRHLVCRLLLEKKKT